MTKLSKEAKRKLWTDTKSYQVTAVLDKAASATLAAAFADAVRTAR